MNSSWRISDEEIFAEITYLDPDLQDDAIPGARSSSKLRVRRSISIALILSVFIFLYFIALRYWPAIVRLMN